MILNEKRMIRKVSLWMISAYNSCRNDSNNQLTKSPTLRTHKTKNVGKKSFELVWTRTILGLAKKVWNNFSDWNFPKGLRYKKGSKSLGKANIKRKAYFAWQKSFSNYSWTDFEVAHKILVPWDDQNMPEGLSDRDQHKNKSENAWQKSFGKFDWKQVALKAYVTLKERQVWTCLKLLPEGLMLRNKNVC